jgi:sugar lactone lactonase YvrE
VLGAPDVLVQFEPGDQEVSGPDGIAFGADGNLYVTHRGSGAVIVVAPDGAIVARHRGGGMLPTNVAFRGTSLYVTEDETHSIYRLDLGVSGQPQFHEAPA